jgi:uncharacterized protein YndB with AHSA1/START domain/DNA-binding transcriptional ArsR family regulator
MEAATLAALGERNRLRIVELLNGAPRSVGEIAAELGLRQPQVTKHLQTLERAGLVAMQPLGQRRIYTLRREPLRELGEWLAAFAREHPSETVLEQYAQAIESERGLALRDPDWARGRTFRLARRLPAPASVVWKYWTSAPLVRQWWSPEHFDVAEAEIDAVAGGRIRLVLSERDGTKHESVGRFLELTRPSRLRFELGPLGPGPDREPLFMATHDVRLSDDDEQRTRLSLTIRIREATATAVPAVAGIQLGWGQLLKKLARALDRPLT